MKSLNKKEQGFTLIEIVIVLAIAAAIILMVFLAVTGVRKSQRDTQRRSDAGRMAATLEQYASNYGGAYPNDANSVTGWFNGYVTNAFKAPNNASYAMGAAIGQYTNAGWLNDPLAAKVPQVPSAASATINKIELYTGVSSSGTSVYSVCISGESTSWVCATS
jgi:prepilin-type N-terminal cleavage/methylation domain-containing protein